MSEQQRNSARRSNSRTGRGSRRSRGHADAIAEAHAQGAETIPDHPLVIADKPELITDPAALDDVAKHVRDAGQFAYDTEFIGEETYNPRICLIQIATAERLVLIDPVDGLDVTPVWELIANEDVEVVVHAGMQDLEPVVRFINKPPRNIFDTQIAAGFAGLPWPISLRHLAAQFADAKLGKGLTFTEWDRRPLSKVHQRYAADDVRYLLTIRESLNERMQRFGAVDYFHDECADLEDADRYVFDPANTFARLVGNRNLKRKAKSILYALMMWRDAAAVEANVPPRSLLKDDVLLRMARSPVKSCQQLANIRGFPRPMADRRGEELIEICQRAADDPTTDISYTSTPDESPDDRVRIDALWSVLSSHAIGRGIDPGLIGNRKRIAELYFNVGDQSPLESGWRKDAAGEVLRALLDGKTDVQLSWRDGRLRSELS